MTTRTQRRGMHLAVTASALAALVAGTLYYANTNANQDTDHQPVIVGGHASLAYPRTTIQDWISFGDYVAVFHLVKGTEKAEEIGQQARNRGEGRVSRAGTIAVEEVLYKRDGARELPREFTTGLQGWWWDQDTGRQEMTMGDTARVETGHTYLGMLVWDAKDKRWSLQAAGGGLIPFDGRVAGHGEFEGRYIDGARSTGDSHLQGIAKQVNGKDQDAVVAALKEAKPYPEAKAHPDLPPAQRYQKAVEAGQAQ